MKFQISNTFENLTGGVARSIGQQVAGLPGDLARKAEEQVLGGKPSEETGPGGNGQTPEQKSPLSPGYRVQDFKRAQQRIAEIRSRIAAMNKQTITSQTEQAKKLNIAPAGPTFRPAPEKPPVSELPVSAKQGKGTGEITRGAIG